ncbi:DUF262 domain-containing protein [Pseudomonas sp. FP597]|uniref:DUF262 domain-containing protein n=1 Tax=Pseudomonas sp. FP597 TaxID=2954096 RepID=UPI002736E945|nr:DUF262 domain-containing protein [Pseudomonas sp. FP597]WLI05870.1 DUF262 domain-containing protein [Pseudomonas sp. FP597]
MTNPSMEAIQTPPAIVLSSKIISVYELPKDSALDIPQYQYPYKWAGKHINQLFSDIAIHKDKSAYHLVTILFHHDREIKNIVDGQQRTISLLLAARALIQRNKEKKLERKDLQESLLTLEQALVNPCFTSEISQKNIRSNYLEVARIVSRADLPRRISTSSLTSVRS